MPLGACWVVAGWVPSALSPGLCACWALRLGVFWVSAGRLWVPLGASCASRARSWSQIPFPWAMQVLLPLVSCAWKLFPFLSSPFLPALATNCCKYIIDHKTAVWGLALESYGNGIRKVYIFCDGSRTFVFVGMSRCVGKFYAN